jgi:16S rRNA (uracil1498-N3)-methyltransferase
MYRALIGTTSSTRVNLPEDEIRHLVQVRRAKKGDQFIGLDGQGRAYLCSLERDPQGWHGNILKQLEESIQPSFSVVLAQALIKKDKFEWVIQKATEIGVAEIVPLITFRTELKMDQEREQRHMTRWRKILSESVKQCGRSQIPQLHPPVSLKFFLTGSLPAFRIALDENGTDALKPIIANRRQESACLVLVGPEGGWADEDRTLFQENGVRGVHLGPRILRAETAGVTVMSILQYELGDLS